mgnify:CR=1 FL=1
MEIEPKKGPEKPKKPRKKAEKPAESPLDPGETGSEVELRLDAKLRRKGYFFDRIHADHVCYFFENCLRHSKGRWAGKPLRLRPWQRARLRRLFGWRKPDGTRRYCRTYWWIPRKNGKSTIAAGLVLYLAFADGEPGAEVYSAASEKDQARIVFDEASAMVDQSPMLKSMIETFQTSLFQPSTRSSYKVVTSKGGSKHGFNVHAAVIDEIHVVKDPALYEVLTSGTGSREQPMEIVISTAGDNIAHFSHEMWEFTIRCRDGKHEDPEFMAVVYCADEGDDWEHESTWRKANPNYGVSVFKERIRSDLLKCKGMPGRIAHFKQVHLNLWTQSVKAWLDVSAWRDLAVPGLKLEAYRGRRCYAGLDLSKTKDLTALSLVFPNDDTDRTFDVLMRFWCPEAQIGARSRNDNAQYQLWADQGHIIPTPGNVVDYKRVREDIEAIAGVVTIEELAYDKAFAGEIVQLLQEFGLTMVDFGQGFMSMATPTAELERRILGQLLTHDGNPVMDWNVQNVIVRTDPAGNIKPDKSKSRERIDGVVAAIMAIGRATLRRDSSSVYETQRVTAH